MIRIVSLTDAGQRLGQRLNKAIADSEHWYKPKPFQTSVQNAFRLGERLILICATGIAVRTLAPVLNNKHTDPAVLVLDELGQFVIPLLSGHEGGANDWAAQVSKMLGAQLVMTTAKPYLKPVYSVGMGCERHCPEHHLAELLSNCLAQAGLDNEQISDINSIDLKADETGLIRLAEQLGKPFRTYNAAALSMVEDQLSTKSDYVFAVTGVYGVAESAALYAAQLITGEAAELVLVKQKTARATCAIARSYPKPPQKLSPTRTSSDTLG
ncbi:MAG: cobalamin biosynthesis protein CbiG [Proteobacteria bacterium]|nr:MAG: cobalamin biosynthesis protein CbiG [Pseudomonadota bacterium]